MSNAPTPAAPAKVDNAKKAPAQKRRSSATKKADKPRKQPTRADIALIDASAQIMETPPTGNDLAFNHGILCQVGLPRSKVDGSSFLRKSGDAWMSVQAGLLDEGKGPVQQPVPYGALPRLALAWMTTYAVRHKTAEIPIGESAAEFLRMMGKDKQGARYKTLRTQMHALAACRLQMGFKGRTWNAQPVEQFDAWINDKESEQRPLWPGTLRLSDSFYNILMESPVPLDNRALDALSGSALALDIYCWLAHRLHRIEGRPITLHWRSLREQFAQEYTGPEADKNFKDAFLPQFRKVQLVYPGARVKQVNGGLLLMPSPPPIPYKG
ncbi:replication protein [Salmonella enterica subsp. enterica serovar Havana]|nr:replication protein [Salmonella enterica subsp. enterica serovar Havana]